MTINLEDLGAFLLTIGIGLIVPSLIYGEVQRRKNARVLRFARKIRQEARMKIAEMREENLSKSQLYLRDRDNKLFKVNIIVDPLLDADALPDAKELRELRIKGEAGTIHELETGKMAVSEDTKDVNDFVFSTKMVKQLHEVGLEPDDIVIRMLRATGRIN